MVGKVALSGVKLFILTAFRAPHWYSNLLSLPVFSHFRCNRYLQMAIHQSIPMKLVADGPIYLSPHLAKIINDNPST